MGVLTAVLLLLISVWVRNKVMPGLLSGIALLLVQILWESNGAALIPIAGNSLLIAAELGLLILGAYSFYRLLDESAHFNGLAESIMENYSHTEVLMLLGWFLCSFFEGIAGFGIPALLIVPLLMKVGYKPASAIVLALSANTLSVCFGALGTPLKIGLGISSPEDVSLHYIRLLLFPLLTLMPVWLLVLASKLEPDKHSLSGKSFFTTIQAGFFISVPLFVTSFFVLEFPSVVAGAVGFIVFMMMHARMGQRWRQLQYWFAFFKPYLALLAVLMFLRFAIGQASWQVHPLFRSINLYQPGIIMLLFTYLWSLIPLKNKQNADYFSVFSSGWKKVSGSLLVILLLVLFSNLIRQPVREMLAGFPAEAMPLVSITALSGVVGSFISGSLTMSNLILADGFRSLAKQSDLLPLLLALLHIGGALGNAISLQNILVVNAILPQPCSIRTIAGFNSFTVLAALLLLLVLGYGFAY